MKSIPLIAATALLLGCGTATQRQEVHGGTPSPVSAVVRDTVAVIDSSALNELYRREKMLNERLQTAMELLRSYVEQEQVHNGHIITLRDSIAQLVEGQREQVEQLTTALLSLQDRIANYSNVVVSPAAPSAAKDSIVLLLEEQALLLSGQPQRLFTIGTDDSHDEVEVTNACQYGSYLLIALSSRSELTSVLLNGKEPIMADGKVFAYEQPSASRLQITATTAIGRQYKIMTTAKKLK